MELKLRQGTRAGGKDTLEMNQGLEQRIGVGALGRFLLTAEAGSQPIQTAPQFSSCLVERLQSEGHPEFFCRRFGRKSGQQLQKPRPQLPGTQRVPRQNISREQAEAAATAAALAAITAPDPLTAKSAAIGLERIVAVKSAMPV